MFVSHDDPEIQVLRELGSQVCFQTENSSRRTGGRVLATGVWSWSPAAAAGDSVWAAGVESVGQ